MKFRNRIIFVSLWFVPAYFMLGLLAEQAADLIHAGAFRDWRIFYDAGLAMSLGLSPFIVPGYFNPIQLAWLLQFTVWIPFPLWVIVMCGLTFAGIFIVAKKAAPFYLLSLPSVFSLWMGMIDMLLWLPARLLGGIGLALLTLKPQLFIVYAPFQLFAWWTARDYKKIGVFGLSAALLWGIPTLIHPAWITEWVHALPAVEAKANASSLGGYLFLFGNTYLSFGVFAVLTAYLIFQRRQNAWFTASSFAPVFSLVDHCINAEFATWRYTLLSWLLFPFGIGVNGAQQFGLLGILIMFEQRRLK